MTKQQAIREQIQKLIPIFNKADINYWIDFGTLLGAVRENDIIEWDSDLDISYLYTDSEYKKITDTLTHNNIKYTCFENPRILLDEKIPTDIYPWKIMYQTAHTLIPEFGIPFFPINHILEFEHIDFCGVKARVPVNRNERLRVLYGDYMKPPKNKDEIYWENENNMHAYLGRLIRR